MKTHIYVILVLFWAAPTLLRAQQDHVRYVMPQVSGVIEELQKEAAAEQAVEDSVTGAIRARQDRVNEADDSTWLQLRLDFSQVARPESPSDFKSEFHFPPIGQFRTGACWCFSTTSFLESEIFRQTGEKIKLSEMFTIYYEYVEKARRYVRERGDFWNDQGSESNAVTRIMKHYGAVPAESYSGKVNDKHFDHTEMAGEVRNYLNFLKQHDYWDEDKAIEAVKLILNKYMGGATAEYLV